MSEKELLKLTSQQRRDRRNNIDSLLYSPCTTRPVKEMLHGFTPKQKLIFLCFISDQFFSYDEVHSLLVDEHDNTSFYKMKKIFIKLFRRRYDHFPESKIREVEEKFDVKIGGDDVSPPPH